MTERPDRPIESDDDPLRYLEALLRAIVFGAAAFATTVCDFLLRPDRFDRALLHDRGGEPPEMAPPYLRPLSFLLLNQVFYFAVYPRRERGPTRAVIDWMPAPILHALDRIEGVVREPDLVSVLLVVGPLVLLAALHAACTTWVFRRSRPALRFEPILAATCYSVGTMLGAVGLSAVVGATLTDHAFAGTLRGLPLAAYLAFMVTPFVLVWLRCISRHFAIVHAATGTSWPRTIGVVLGTTLALGVLVAGLLALVGWRGPEATGVALSARPPGA